MDKLIIIYIYRRLVKRISLFTNAICDSGELGNDRDRSAAIDANRIGSEFEKFVDVADSKV